MNSNYQAKKKLIKPKHNQEMLLDVGLLNLEILFFEFLSGEWSGAHNTIITNIKIIMSFRSWRHIYNSSSSDY